MIALADPDCMNDKQLIVSLVGLRAAKTPFTQVEDVGYAILCWRGFRPLRLLRIVIYRRLEIVLSSKDLATVAIVLNDIQNARDAVACIWEIKKRHDWWDGHVLLDVAGNGTPNSSGGS